PLTAIFDDLRDVEEEKQPLDVEGREIAYRKRAGGLVWFDFAVLCGGPRSYADYVDLAKRFHTVMLSNVPRLSAKDSDAARRFTSKQGRAPARWSVRSSWRVPRPMDTRCSRYRLLSPAPRRS